MGTGLFCTGNNISTEFHEMFSSFGMNSMLLSALQAYSQ